MRADVYLFNYGYARSRQSAKQLIENGAVRIDGRQISKPSAELDESGTHEVVITEKPRFVSRGGEKLDFALEQFGISALGRMCLDIGASTGGFTDCLLSHGAKGVFAVDSGHSQLAPELAGDSRVRSIEKYNARYMKAEDFPCSIDLAVMDVSFISQTLIHQGISTVLSEGGELVSLIKPQFECGRGALDSHGIVRSAVHHRAAVERVIESAAANGLACLGVIRSPIEGGSGNVEFLAHFVRTSQNDGLPGAKLPDGLFIQRKNRK